MPNATTFGETPTSDDKLLALVAHLSAFFLPFIGALGLYLVCRDKPFVAYHAAQSLAAQAVISALGAAVTVLSFLTCGIGAVLFAPLAVAPIIPLFGAYLAYDGRWSGYPGIEGIGR